MEWGTSRKCWQERIGIVGSSVLMFSYTFLTCLHNKLFTLLSYGSKSPTPNETGITNSGYAIATMLHKKS